MQRTDLETPALVALSFSTWHSPLARSLCLPAILISYCAIFGAAQCSAQDVAEAARQQRAQKESKQEKSKHVYTEKDLKRAQILTPGDRAQVEAKKNQTTPPTAEKSADAVDAQSLARDAPLGDVARRFRKQKESQNLERSAEFHLPVVDAPVLASPRPPVAPLPLPALKPAPPKFVPYRPPVKRSPFERPRVFVAPPSLPPARPPVVSVTPSQPAAPTPVAPVAPTISAPPNGVAKLNAVIVKPGDSLWKIAQQNLGKGLRWRDLLSVNPAIVDANRIVVGSRIYLPAAASARAATKITVKKGDTLTSIARAQLGHSSHWSCIAQANPAVHDANLIYEGQLLLLPAQCGRP